MKIKKPLLIAGAVTTIAGASLAGVASVSAATSTSTNTNGSSSLIDKIAAKFNLNKDDVKAVFDQDRTDHEAERQQKLEARLSQAVTDGKITADQKTKILTKLAELKTQREANRDAMKDKTDAERKAAMDKERTDLEQWAKDNGISMDYLRDGGGPGGHGGPGMDGGTPPADQQN